MNKRELEEELKRTSTGRKLLEETEFANPTNDMIGFAKEQCEIFPEDSYMGKYLRETIKILQAEPCKDAVSRSQALKELEESAKHHANDSREEVLLRRDRDIIRALPPVKPTRNKGKWIEVDTNMYTCSNCSHCFEIVPEVNSIHQFKCCPNCKAEM